MGFLNTFLALMAITAVHARGLSPLAEAPNWSKLERFQETITSERFRNLLENVYAPEHAAAEWIKLGEHSARILDDGALVFELRFAAEGKERRARRFWKRAAELPPAPKTQPLKGYRIAIDPGHLGGPWAKMEARWFQIGSGIAVTEGDMTLSVARALQRKLRALGAQVMLVRNSDVPTTAARPATLRSKAIQSLRSNSKALTAQGIRRESERLFYRVAEIRGRAIFLNTRLKPDLTLCLHFNAEAWGKPQEPQLTEANHFHFLVNGCYSSEELSKEDVRFEMLRKLLSGALEEEVALSEQIGNATKRITGLAAYQYRNAGAVRLGEFTWGRNLLANRLYDCPVVFAELYVMNNRIVYDRVQLGAYRGLQPVEGVLRHNLYEEYAEAITAGLREHLGRQKKTACPERQAVEKPKG